MHEEIEYRHWDIRLLELEVRVAFDVLFSGPPEIDWSDPLDGESLSKFNGKKYYEVEDIIEGGVDGFPFFALVSPQVGRYYVGGYIIFFLRKMEICRNLYPESLCSFVVTVEYLTFMAFLRQDETVSWVASMPRMADIVCRFLNLMMNTAGFEYEGENLNEMRAIKNSINLCKKLN